MSEKDILQNMISALGQSQEDRVSRELSPHHADVDERGPLAQHLFVKKLAPFVRFYRDHILSPSGSWAPFFPDVDPKDPRLPGADDGLTPPHRALWIAFLELMEEPRRALNRLTGEHRTFFYERVLRFQREPAIPDRAHVTVQLKKNAAPLLLSPEHRLSAGKDRTGVELVYAPVRDTVVNRAKVDSVRSIFVDPAGLGAVRFAPVANSSDGLGGELTDDEPRWPGFGHAGLPAAKIGFAVASPTLRLAEGNRQIRLALRLGELAESGLTVTHLASALEAYVTGEKGWLGPYTLSPTLSGDELSLRFELPASDPKVVDYDAATHGLAFETALPVVQILLKPGDARVGYGTVKGLTLRRIQVFVEASAITSLTLENDHGRLDPRKVFQPFGPQPAAGSRFMVGYPEAFSKQLDKIVLGIQWYDLPESFASRYAHYGVIGVNDDHFTANVAFEDAGIWRESTPGVRLFSPRDKGTGERLLDFAARKSLATGKKPASPASELMGLAATGASWSLKSAQKKLMAEPMLAKTPGGQGIPVTSQGIKAGPAPGTLDPKKAFALPPRAGFITLSLEKGFLHAEYRQKMIEYTLRYAKTGDALVVLQEPYTPAIKAISLSYEAHSAPVDIDSASLGDFVSPDVQLFHVGCFGQMREHRYQREQLGFVADKRVHLFPRYSTVPGAAEEGQMLVGLTGLGPGDSVSILFQVAEGSADPDLPRQPIRWSVLCDNHWRDFTGKEMTLDTTNQLLRSGVVSFVIPREATTENTILPTGRIWLRASVSRHVRAVCQLVAAVANAVEVELRSEDNDPAHLLSPLPQGSIARLKSPVSGVQKVSQPYASFGGRPPEPAGSLAVRASERLRHKGRCLSAWDYERIVLAAFPGIHRVKCIPHAKDGSWLAPGNVLVVVIPDLRNRNAVNPLEPRVDADTLDRITELLQARAGMGVRVHVKNPRYQRVRLDFKLKLHAGFEHNYYSALLKEEIVRHLSPWAYPTEGASPAERISFGGRVHRSALLDFVEHRPYVDYVTDFKLHTEAAGIPASRDLAEVTPQTPDALLVSAPPSAHSVAEAP